MRTFLAIIVGIVVALIVQSAGDAVASLLYPTGMTNMWNRAQVAEALANRPAAALWITVAGYLLGGLLGGAAGKAISRVPAAAWTPAILLAVMAAIIGWSFPTNAWASIANVAGALIGAMLANHLVMTRAPAPVEEEVPAGADL